MAFTAKILSWRFRHLNVVGCLLKRRPTKGGGGHGHPRTPPSYAPEICCGDSTQLALILRAASVICSRVGNLTYDAIKIETT